MFAQRTVKVPEPGSSNECHGVEVETACRSWITSKNQTECFVHPRQTINLTVKECGVDNWRCLRFNVIVAERTTPPPASEN